MQKHKKRSPRKELKTRRTLTEPPSDPSSVEQVSARNIGERKRKSDRERKTERKRNPALLRAARQRAGLWHLQPTAAAQARARAADGEPEEAATEAAGEVGLPPSSPSSPHREPCQTRTAGKRSTRAGRRQEARTLLARRQLSPSPFSCGLRSLLLSRALVSLLPPFPARPAQKPPAAPLRSFDRGLPDASGCRTALLTSFSAGFVPRVGSAACFGSCAGVSEGEKKFSCAVSERLFVLLCWFFRSVPFYFSVCGRVLCLRDQLLLLCDFCHGLMQRRKSTLPRVPASHPRRLRGSAL